ncbi:MAG: S-adenosylmethionine:tRNA ribosyltransferase-isomerase [Solirubrobacteraceae bacterium]
MSALAFKLPSALEAREPPEARGLARDQVRLLVATRSDGGIAHASFRDLPSKLRAGDLLVLNVSGTLPAAVRGKRGDGTAVRVHFATRAPCLGPAWRVVELRSPDGARPGPGRAGERVELPGGATLELTASYAPGGASTRLWLAHFHSGEPLEDYLAWHGEPIRYGYAGDWPLEAYQTVYASSRGSAEMPSAGRPFTAELIARLIAGGVLVAPITLHTGVSSPERDEPPFPEYYKVPGATASLVRAVRRSGGRVIAVGTTVVRALESAAGSEGMIMARAGWTSLVIEPDRGLSAVDGLITGWHEPEASHLQLLEAAAGQTLLSRSYRAALQCGYLWHEFGDSHLILP